eukprot:CAMPEP_0196724532 /NCGR_PEP_ID=MMETSP1091-20130531/6338_1 /TAXON_ID=302021 /ORGANISM="Rhodomonas sp., Strain CCMP768" /LENGTH=73 /DNA_ID=CAMNT_0042066661 /DNA_START=235 /DNA_END=457 /DNA_ORIENTATION=-
MTLRMQAVQEMFALLRHLQQQGAQPHADLRDSRTFEVLLAMTPDLASSSLSSSPSPLPLESADLRDANSVEYL